jgi:hypothetical protein
MDVKSAWFSKINWTQAIGLLASVLVVFGIDLTVEVQLALVGAIQGAVAVLTWVLKTFFTSTVTPSVAAKQ